MTNLAALALIAGLIVVATALGLLWRGRQGAITTERGASVRAMELSPAAAFGSAATLVQFSTEFCARCPATRRLLGALAQSHPGVSHIDVDLTHRPDLARRFQVMQTPTTLVLDRDGRVRARIGGAPKRADVAEHLARLTGTDPAAPAPSTTRTNTP
ncbi:MAG: thioredoxin family protein [Cryobacterium sp.]